VATVPHPGASVLAFGFPNVGGGVSSLTEVAESTPPELELRTVNLPGRQARIWEDSRTDLDGLVEDLAAAVAADADRPFLLYGDCSGALTAWLVADRLRDRGLPLPAALVLAALEAPHRLRVPRSVKDVDGEDVWDTIAGIGGFPPELAEDEDFRDLLEPALRADFGMVSRFVPTPREPLSVPFTIMLGELDRRIDEDDLDGWRGLTTVGIEVIQVAGCDHWIARDNPAAAGRILGEVAAR
jgi:medium-chain acyl-[acyl-carrier-protein] hydrolase